MAVRGTGIGTLGHSAILSPIVIYHCWKNSITYRKRNIRMHQKYSSIPNVLQKHTTYMMAPAFKPK